jgi:hypothetical protein
MRNDSATSLLGRADLGHRLSASMPVTSGEELEEARAYEDQLTALLQTHEEGCCTHVVLEEGVRTVNFQVADAAAAITHAQSLQEELDVPVTLDLVFDPTWKSYRVWLAEAAAKCRCCSPLLLSTASGSVRRTTRRRFCSGSR